MQRLSLVLALGALLVAALVFEGVASSASPGNILEFDSLAPVVSPFTGATNSIRGIPGGGVPWQIQAGKGNLSSTGRLDIEVKGLVIIASGVNPIADFRGVVNCLTPDSPTTGVNVSTDPVPTDSSGDVEIKQQLDLPSPCIAPIIFVTNGTVAAPGAWFATTGAS